MKSRIDQTDPNPAHKLSHSISELTIKEGRQINPRFANVRPQRSGIGSRIAEPRGDKETSAGIRATGNKSLYNKVKPQSELISREKMPSMRKGLVNGGTGLRRMEIHSVAANEFTISNPDILKEGESDDLVVEVGAEVGNRPLNLHAFAEESEMESFNEEESKPLESNTGIGICGMEVSNNDTETTVVLKHILALAGQKTEAQETSLPSLSQCPSDLTIVEEDELEEYYESNDSYNCLPSSEIPSMYTLPHLIPQLVITNEDDELVETVVDQSRKFESVAASLQRLQMVKNEIKVEPISVKSFGMLDAFNEEEEEEEDEVTTTTRL